MVLGGGMALTEAARSMGGVSYKTESSPITPVKQSLVFLYGMFNNLVPIL